MWKNYLKIALRNLWKTRFYSALNVTGLAVGIASCLLIYLYISDEMSYDRFNKKADRIYRVGVEMSYSGNYGRWAQNAAAVGPAIKEEIPEVEDMVRFRPMGTYLVKKDQSAENFKTTGLVFTESNFFNIFTVPLVLGDPKTVLDKKFSIALSESEAHKYFGNENPIGKTLILDNDQSYQVTGVFKDIPENSHFHFNMLASIITLDDIHNPTFLSFNYNTYILAKPGVSREVLQEKIQQMYVKHVQLEISNVTNQTYDDFKKQGNFVKLHVFPLLDIHLRSHLKGDFEANGDIQYVYIFGSTALFILILACINFINLSTARSRSRSKEVGVRKSLGSERKQLIFQFLTESSLIAFFGLLLALILISVVLPYFNAWTGKAIGATVLLSGRFVLVFLLVLLVTGILAGSYPALVLSSFEPVKVLKGGGDGTAKGSGILRNALVVFQFTISIGLIIAALIVQDQLSFIQNRKIGFQKDQAIIVNDSYALGDNIEAYKQNVLQHAQFKSATVSSFLPVNYSSRSDSPFWPYGKSISDPQSSSMQMWRIDENYIPTLGMDIVAGRNFKATGEDSLSVILNQAAVKKLGLEDPVGKRIQTFASFNFKDPNMRNNFKTYRVVGVVKDFNYESMKQKILPLAFFNQRSTGSITFKVASKDVQSAVSVLSTEWKKLAPQQPFDYNFLDQRFMSFYKGEQRAGQVISAFTLLTIFVACLGLFGLSAFTAEKRFKEIGVRKVLGASVSQVVLMLVTGFLTLVGISFLIAAPLAYWGMHYWLEDFVYKTSPSLWLFVWTCVGTMAIAFFTVAFQSFKAARVNPVNVLKSE